MTSLVPDDWLAWSMLAWTFVRIGLFFLLLYVVFVAGNPPQRGSDV